MDPLKDATARIAQLCAGFVSQPEAAGASGYDVSAAVEMIREADARLGAASRRLLCGGACDGRPQPTT